MHVIQQIFQGNLTQFNHGSRGADSPDRNRRMP